MPSQYLHVLTANTLGSDVRRETTLSIITDVTVWVYTLPAWHQKTYCLSVIEAWQSVSCTCRDDWIRMEANQWVSEWQFPSWRAECPPLEEQQGTLCHTWNVERLPTYDPWPLAIVKPAMKQGESQKPVYTRLLSTSRKSFLYIPVCNNTAS